jgi:hypothetical protein
VRDGSCGPVALVALVVLVGATSVAMLWFGFVVCLA